MYDAVDNIYSVLENDATLSAYVKQFTKGGINKNFMQYPFINVGHVEMNIEETGIGGIGAGGYNIMKVAIECGTKSTIPEVAFFGDAGQGVKGILQMLDDIRAVCRANTFNCTFTIPAKIIRVVTDVITVKAEWIWVAECTLEGRRKEPRLR